MIQASHANIYTDTNKTIKLDDSNKSNFLHTMSVPLERLYNHLDGLCNHDSIIYGFFPHGSKNLENINSIIDVDQLNRVRRDLSPIMLCHDQEPIGFSLSPTDIKKFFLIRGDEQLLRSSTRMNMVDQWVHDMGLRSVFSNRFNVYDRMLLIHSEHNSTSVKTLEDHGFEPVYWWAHAAIAADWFRYAQHDKDIGRCYEFNYDFLIYNRAWSGTREYRLKFLEILLDSACYSNCRTNFNPVCDELHYKNYNANNKSMQVTRFDFEKFFMPTAAGPESSADYCLADYQQCAVEVVLETLFDDQRIQLTEKILRPIALGHPFILMSTAGSLKYLREYGFETFSPFINESYDNIVDPALRLQAVVAEIKRISNLSQDQKRTLWENLFAIAMKNRIRFFDGNWQNQIFLEFVSNYQTARQKINITTAKWWKYGNTFPRTYEPGVDPGQVRDQIVTQWINQNCVK